MTGIVTAVGEFFGTIRAWLDKARQREALKNAADKQAAAERANAQAVVEKLRKDVESENLEAIRSDIAAPDVSGTGRL